MGDTYRTGGQKSVTVLNIVSYRRKITFMKIYFTLKRIVFLQVLNSIVFFWMYVTRLRRHMISMVLFLKGDVSLVVTFKIGQKYSTFKGG